MSTGSFSTIVVGGGLAGCSAALALARRGVKVTLLESRRRLGGRTGSFANPAASVVSASGEVDSNSEIDYCQHVGMGCCTNLKQLIKWLDQGDDWATHRQLHFFGPDGRYQKLGSLPWVPAPTHLAHWLWRWPGLGLRDRLSVLRGMSAIYRLRQSEQLDDLSALCWLQQQGQTPTCIERFWNTIIVSALGEETGRVSLGAVCKVLQDGFMKHREAFHILVPQRPLSVLFGKQMLEVLKHHGVNVRCGQPAQDVRIGDDGRPEVRVRDDGLVADSIVVAVPWHKLGRLAETANSGPIFKVAQSASQIVASPITGIHTWWDRPWLDYPHATIVGRLCQWVFPHHDASNPMNHTRAYYQIVVSASRQLPTGLESDQIGKVVQEDLGHVFPKVLERKLLQIKVVTDRQAVFSVAPGVNRLRPITMQTQRCVLAGDWTQTGWPATMESAILSGFRAADALRAALVPSVNAECDERPPLGG